MACQVPFPSLPRSNVLRLVCGLHLVHPCPQASLVTSRDVIDFQEGRPIEHTPLARR